MGLQTRNSGTSTQETAEKLAVLALAFLTAETERLGAFLAATGLGPENLRTAAQEPGFLPGVLDYLIANEPVLVAFAEEHGFDPAAVVASRAALPGGGLGR